MRKGFSFHIGRGLRELRPPRSPAEQRRRQRMLLVLVMLALAGALWAILAVRPPATPGLQPGKPSPVDIRASRSISFESKLLTEEARKSAESAPENIKYKRDPNIVPQQRIQLAELLDSITQIRDDASLDRNAKRERLAALPLPAGTLAISQPLALAILRLPSDQWVTVHQESLNLYDRAVRDNDFELSDETVARLREGSLPYWSSQVAKGEARNLMLTFTTAFLKPNRVLDEAATKQRKEEARDAVKPVMVSVQQNQIIVRAGDIVTPEIQERLEALGELRSEVDWFSIGGKGLLAVLITSIFGMYLGRTQHEVWMNTRPLLVVAGLFALTVLAARLALPLSGSWLYIFPLAMTGLLLATLFNRGLAVVATSLLSLLIVFVANNQAPLAATLLLSSMAGIFTISRGERSLTFVLSGATVALTAAMAQAAFWFTTPGGPLLDQWAPILIASTLNGGLSAILALGLYNLVGHLADVVTPLQLMELAHPAHPLLRKLIREAPGTYYHSVSVGNLAESAAEAIGADALLLRVASYYHDIGKTIRPYFFTDNQSDRENVHNDLDPHISAEIIAEHVSEGIKMAREAGLPRQIIEFIPAHHGTSVIKHFYQMALQKEDTVDVADYRYPGPKPRTREQAIMMLADTVEATVRSKAQNGKIASSREDHANGNGRGHDGRQTLEELVASIIDERIRSGQLDESPLTLQDIARIKQAFVNTLQGIYHPRVDYAPQLVKPS